MLHQSANLFPGGHDEIGDCGALGVGLAMRICFTCSSSVGRCQPDDVPLVCWCRTRGSHGYIAQWLERLTADQQVPGSNPGVPFQHIPAAAIGNRLIQNLERYPFKFGIVCCPRLQMCADLQRFAWPYRIAELLRL